MHTKTILVTGASGAIGGAVARRFLKQGHRVILVANRNATAIEELANTEPLAICAQCDLSSKDSIHDMVEGLKRRVKRIDVLINNAGIALEQKLVTDCTADEWDRLFAIDVRGLFLLTRALLPGMISEKSGSIVNVSSIWGLVGGSCEVPYSTAKAAVVGFTKSLAKEVGPSGIRVNCVAPGFIDTHMNAHLDDEARRLFCEDLPLGRLGYADEVASAVAFLALDEASYITGQVLAVDGGYAI